jgi:hypothetical protein
LPGLYNIFTTGRPLKDLGRPAAEHWPSYRPHELRREATAHIGAYLRHLGPGFVSCHKRGGNAGLDQAAATDADLNRNTVVNLLSAEHFLGPNTPLRVANFLTPATIVTCGSGAPVTTRELLIVPFPLAEPAKAVISHSTGQLPLAPLPFVPRETRRSFSHFADQTGVPRLPAAGVTPGELALGQTAQLNEENHGTRAFDIRSRPLVSGAKFRA